MSQKICKECGAEYTAKKAHSKFCSTKCRKDYNNRRAVRGAQLYDVFMAIRYDREAATKYGLDRTFISRMGEMFNEEDKGSSGPHGKSYRCSREVKEELGCQVNARRGRA